MSAPRKAARRPTVAALISWIFFGLLGAVCALQWQQLASYRSAISLHPETKPPWPYSQMFDAHHSTHIVIADASFGLLNVIRGKEWTFEDYLKPDFFKTCVGLSSSKGEQRLCDYISRAALTGRDDVLIVASILALAGSFRDRISIDSARDLKLRDLDKGNYIFLGDEGSIPWVALFQNRLNFKRSMGQVVERSKFFRNSKPRPGEQTTYVGLAETGTTGDEYTDIALVPNGSQEGSILILEGTQQEGTEAAGELLADPERRHTLLQALGLSSDPKEKIWFEALIRVRVVEGTPVSDSVVATRIIH